MVKSREIVQWKGTKTGAGTSVTLGQDSDTLFSMDVDGVRRLWDVRLAPTIREIAVPKIPEGRLVFGPDRRRFATVTAEKVTVWRLRG